jgi:hypothetical protein
MLAHDIITADQHAAAQRYRQLRAALYGSVLARQEPGSVAPDPDVILKMQRQFDHMAGRLSVPQKLAVTDIALDIRPRWLRAQLLGLPVAAADELEKRDLLDGLDAIA